MRSAQTYIKGNEKKPYTTIQYTPNPETAGGEWRQNRAFRRAKAKADKRRAALNQTQRKNEM